MLHTTALAQQRGDVLMKITELFPDVITEDMECEFKAVLNSENPVKWAKTIVGLQIAMEASCLLGSLTT